MEVDDKSQPRRVSDSRETQKLCKIEKVVWLTA